MTQWPPAQLQPVATDRATFFALLNRAIEVARQDSAPVLLHLELHGLHRIAEDYGSPRQKIMAEVAAARLAEVLGDNGYVCALRQARIAVLAASDGNNSPNAIAAALLAALASPIMVDGVQLTPGAALSIACWGRDGETAEELFVAADVAMRRSRDALPQIDRVAQAAHPTPHAELAAQPRHFNLRSSPLAIKAG